MKVFGTLESKDYTVEDIYASAPMSWELVSSSAGIVISNIPELDGAITIQQATNDPDDFFQYDVEPKVNEITGVYEYLLYRSVKHMFYDRGNFYSGSLITTSSITGLPDNVYIISIGQNFYGDRIKPGTFELSTEVANKYIYDDDYGNLYISESGVPHYVGNIFYDNGIAVIKRNTTATTTTVSGSGLKLVEDSVVYLDYSSDVKMQRHQVNVSLRPSEFNFSPFNPSILSTFEITGSVTQSLVDQNITPVSGSSAWNLYNLMSARIIKPYVTSIGLYNEQYELLAVAKLSEPIQRTFDVNQIFIIRFDT